MGGCIGVEVSEVPEEGSGTQSGRAAGIHGRPEKAAKNAGSSRSGHVDRQQPAPSPRAQGLEPPTQRADIFMVKKFKIQELKSACNSFSRKNLLGEGSFGEVFRGVVLDKGSGESTKIAVKVLNPESSQGLDEWLQEVIILPSLSHPNLIRLLGYCSERGEAMLVYELCENGSLDDRLFPEGKTKALTWAQRVDIIHGVAKGLVHLHKNHIIHRDLKPGNILLDSRMVAKVTDFGMAKQATKGETHLSTRVMGTMGYLDPSYMETGCLREKSDVYSFGVILLQILTGRDAVDDNNQKLAHLMYDYLHPNISDPAKWIDPTLEGVYSRKGALMLAAIAKRCVEDGSEARPEMADIAEFLKDVPR